jgi:uncharacterized iron-regulated membrane protein
MNPLFWRRWHRWIAFPATLFLLFASVTGVLVAWSEFFGEEEAEREATRELVSPVTAQADPSSWEARLRQAFQTVGREAGAAPVDKVTMQFKGKTPTITLYTGKPGGGEDRRFVMDAASGKLRSVSSYADKPFLHRLHSGEALGDGGLVMAMFWGAGLAFLTLSGLLIYLLMWRPGQQGLRKLFW